MDQKETPQLLSRLNEIVERSRLKRDRKTLPNENLRTHERFPTGRVSFSERRSAASGH